MEEKKRNEEKKDNLKSELKKKVHHHHRPIDKKENSDVEKKIVLKKKEEKLEGHEKKHEVHKHHAVVPISHHHKHPVPVETMIVSKHHKHMHPKQQEHHKHRHKHPAATNTAGEPREEKEKIVRELPLEKRKITNEKEIAMDFAEKVHKKFDRMIKASVLFGSQTKQDKSPGSDIDVILIIDDASINWDLELVAWYREELGKIISEQNYSKDLHINTIKLTTWWQDFMHGDPVVINILRYGEALIDSGGFFNPLKALLLQGRVRSTPEAVYNALQRAPAHLTRSKMAMLGSIEGVYWTMIDAAQAALITAGQLPPSPEHIPKMLKTTFVDRNIMKIDKVRELRDIYVMHKGIMHREIHEVKGSEVDKWQDIAQNFLLEMTRLIDRILDSAPKEK